MPPVLKSFKTGLIAVIKEGEGNGTEPTALPYMCAPSSFTSDRDAGHEWVKWDLQKLRCLPLLKG